MDILIIIDNISQNYKWCKNFNTIKRWIIYWMNENLKNGNLKSFSVGKTYLEPCLMKLENDNLKIENIIVLLDSIVIKKTEVYNCVNIKNIFDMILQNKFIKQFEYKKIINENKSVTFDNDDTILEIKNRIADNKRIKKKNIIIEEEKDKNNYTDIYVFASIIELILTTENIKYIKDSLVDNKIPNVNFINFSKKKVISIDPKILEKSIFLQNVDNYELYVEMSQLLNLKPQLNDFTKNDLDVCDILLKLYEIEFENYKKSNWSEDPISKNIANIYFNYVENLNQTKQSNFEISNGTYVNFIKHCINWVRMIFLEKNNNINFNIPSPNINSELMSDYVVEIIKFYQLVYPKLLFYHVEKKKYSFTLKKLSQLNFSNIKIKNFINDNSTNYLYSSTTMSNWKQEYENLNPFGIFLKYDLSPVSHRGIYEHDIISTYPNMIISSISNNLISLFDYYQLISADIDTSTITKFNINDYIFIDNLHGNSNIMLPLYINSEHWKITKIYWTYHMSFINGAFEFDYVKKMDNIYFLVFIKMINTICNVKYNQNISRLLFYILRTTIQICIDNKYSYNNKSDYDKYYNLLLTSCNQEIFKKTFIDYLIRLIQAILTNNIQISEINEHMNCLFCVYIKHTIKIDHNNDYFENINKLPIDEKIKEIEYLNNKFNLNILCFSELKKDMLFLSEFMTRIFSIKKFNKLINFLDKNNGCLPIFEDDLNCNIIDSIVCELIIKNNSFIIDGNDIVKKTGLIVI